MTTLEHFQRFRKRDRIRQHLSPTLRAKSGSQDRKSTRLNSSHGYISYAVFCLKKKNLQKEISTTENTVSFARHSYSYSRMSHNTCRDSFPGNLLAGSCGFCVADILPSA